MDISYYKKYEPIFGSWHIVREIGEGSFGKVFEIEREDFGYTYKSALKAVTIPQTKSEVKSLTEEMDNASITRYFRGFVEEMVQEFNMMSKLKGHSNIVSYEDHVVVTHNEDIGWDILIRMELLTPLAEYVNGESLPRSEVIKLGIDMCKALEACRKHQIIHRDIKPENIFVSELGNFKLGDFGIAKTVEKTTGGLSRKGTYSYMAPEIYKGESYGPSVDIYSLGLVLYRYLNNNRVPFLPEYPEVIKHSDREEAMVRRIKGERIPAPANADKALANIILKACAYDPKDRYASPTEMRIALESLDEETAVSAPVLKNETTNISEAESVCDVEKECDDATVVLVDPAEEETIIEYGSDETVCIDEEDESETAAEVCAAEAKTVQETINRKEPVKAGENAVKQPGIEKTNKPKKKKAIIGIVAAALAVLAIALAMNRLKWNVAEDKVHLEDRYTYPIVLAEPVERCNEIKFSYKIKDADNNSIYGRQNVYVKSPTGMWKYAGDFYANNGNTVDVDIHFAMERIAAIAVVPDTAFGHYTYKFSHVKCIQGTYGN